MDNKLLVAGRGGVRVCMYVPSMYEYKSNAGRLVGAPLVACAKPEAHQSSLANDRASPDRRNHGTVACANKVFITKDKMCYMWAPLYSG